jgi:hypothetical protein
VIDIRIGQLGYPIAYKVLCSLSEGRKDNEKIARELGLLSVGGILPLGNNDSSYIENRTPSGADEYLWMLKVCGFATEVARYGWNIREFELTEDGKREIAERKFIKSD